MELGSGSRSGSGSGSSTESSSLNSLKFGQKIYFEDDVGGTTSSGAPVKGSGSGSGRKVRGGGGGGVVVTGAKPARCQVEGCNVDLSDAKAYYSRHKVCGMHSKSPVVTVAGLDQRFCQQCSRFHQLPEFDQGKRSCRRRLAGHNERRRKPPPGPFLGTRYRRLSSSVIENWSQGGGFLVNFSAYQMGGGRDGCRVTRVSDQVSGNQTTVRARHLPQPLRQNHSQDPPPDRYQQLTTGVSGSNCALSLLSNQPWASSNHASVTPPLLMSAHASVTSPLLPHGAAVNQYPNMLWGFKGNGAGSSSNHMAPQLGVGPNSVPINGQYSGEQYHSRDCDNSAQQMHWSL